MSRVCLALAYDKVHLRQKSDAQISALTADLGNSVAYQMAEIFAQRGDTPKALEWLETAYRLHDAGLAQIKADRWVDPLRSEPRFRQIERKLYPEDGS